MTAIKPQTGFVGFFDILGYKQIILNNDIHKTAEIVSDTLVNIPSTIIENISTASSDSYEMSPWHEILAGIDWLLFSDSVVVTLPIDSQLPLNALLQHYAAFVTVCATLLNKSFAAGFPLRGSISLGEFFIEERCFAGKPIISAYQAAQQLEFSGCILDEEANNFVSQARRELVKQGGGNMLTMLDQTTILYMVPTKDGSSERLRTINWVLLDIKGFPKFDGSIRDYVTSSFLRHNKIALPGVQPKINNTEMFVRHVLTNLEIKPWSINDQVREI